MTYSVVMYTRGTDFSITARRTEGGRLDEVNAQNKSDGFAEIPILDGLSKQKAGQLKVLLTASMTVIGYRRVTRRAL